MFPDPDADGVPDVAGVRDDVRDALVTFVRALRRAGVAVPSNAGVVAARALVEMGFDDERRARAALRAVLVTRERDIDTFDRLFAEFWRRLGAHLDGDAAAGLAADGPDGRLAPLGAANADEDRAGEAPDADDGDGDDDRTATGERVETDVVRAALSAEPPAGTEGEATMATYSPAGGTERVTVDAGAGPDEEALTGAVTRLVDALATLPGRRWERTATGDRVDARRTLRRSLSTGGSVATLPRRRRRRTALRAVVLADVSRSVLDAVDRGFLLRFLRALRAELRSGRVLFFDSDVRDVTAAFDAPTTAEALRELERAETQWGGGTRIGGAVATLRDEYRDSVDRRTAVLIVSDGLEMGDVSGLERGMSWLSSHARTVLWLNPLAASPAYEPRAEGMATATPFVDGVFAFTRPDDVTELARQLERNGATGRIGFEHDPRRAGDERHTP